MIALTLVELLVVIVAVAILVAFAIPVFSSIRIKRAQSHDLENAKTLGLGLRLYASDNKGVFPTSTTSANAAYRYIVPSYIPTQKVFFLEGSGWCTGSHPVEYGPSGTLAGGQNGYAYVSGLKDSDNTNYPLVADGFNEGAPGVYNSVTGTKGGLGKGMKVVVIRVDDSGLVETVEDDYRVHANGANTDNANADIFTTGATWMPSGTVLNPE